MVCNEEDLFLNTKIDNNIYMYTIYINTLSPKPSCSLKIAFDTAGESERKLASFDVFK